MLALLFGKKMTETASDTSSSSLSWTRGSPPGPNYWELTIYIVIIKVIIYFLTHKHHFMVKKILFQACLGTMSPLYPGCTMVNNPLTMNSEALRVPRKPRSVMEVTLNLIKKKFVN
jgi:hypothetical protein